MENNIFTNFKKWKKDFSKNWVKIVLTLILILISIQTYNFSGRYVDNVAGAAPSSDIILDFIPSINLNFIYVWGFLSVSFIIILYPLLFKLKEAPMYFFFFFLFTCIRSGFIVLTHLQASPDALPLHLPFFLESSYFNNDLFFSGHTGLPFLAFLMFKEKFIKIFMLISSIVFALTVLFMHAHYSIDVVAAYFITYGIYKLGILVVNKKRKLFFSNSK